MTNKRSQDVRTQIHVWSKLLEGRIALQKVVIALREFENVRTRDADQQIEAPEADETAIKSISKLLSCLVRLRDTYRHKSQFHLDGKDDQLDSDEHAKIDDNNLDAEHDQYNDLRASLIEKWYEKTKIGVIPKKGYTVLELPTLQLIKNALKDKERLIRRTQVDRTSEKDEFTHPEIFNDDDFYHQLLKEMVNKDESRNWVELQRLRYKTKRKADTKATKGRKIKKDLIPKLVNFMAPYRPINVEEEGIVPEKIRNELMRSLFGGSVMDRPAQDIDTGDDK